GGSIHRASLSSGILIKENHIHAYGGIKKAVRALREQSPHLLKIEVEVRNIEELSQAVTSKADVVMLDNFSPKQVQDALVFLSTAPHQPVVEVSGGISKENISQYLIAGVDIISIGALTHSVFG